MWILELVEQKLTDDSHVEDGCQKRKVHNRKSTMANRPTAVNLRAKPVQPLNSAISNLAPTALKPTKLAPLIKTENY